MVGSIGPENPSALPILFRMERKRTILEWISRQQDANKQGEEKGPQKLKLENSHVGWDQSVTLEQLRALQDKFSKDRDWDKHHIPRNVLLAMMGEVGEVAELFQWRQDPDCTPGLPKWTEAEKVINLPFELENWVSSKPLSLTLHSAGAPGGGAERRAPLFSPSVRYVWDRPW